MNKEHKCKIEWPDFTKDHPAQKLFEKMTIRDFGMICHFFGYLMVPEAKIRKLVADATILKTVLPDPKMVKQAIKAVGVAKVKKEQTCQATREPQVKRKFKDASKSGTRKRTLK